MRAPLSWIREFTPVDADPATVADALDNLGLEVEAVDAPGEEILDVTAAKVLEVAKHPNADKLSLVEIETGDGTTSVVCGAPNVVAGMVVPYAPLGVDAARAASSSSGARSAASSPTGCSARAKELGLGEDHSGILGLPEDTELGADVRDVLELHDVVFDLSITPNRPDAMSIVGVARDLAAHFGLPFSVPEPQIDDGRRADGVDDLSVVVEAPDRCPRFTARRIEVDDGAVARVARAPPDARGHAADLERRRRHQLRPARAGPAAARVRPRPAARARASSSASPRTARR